MLWYDITFSLDKAVLPLDYTLGLTALALFSAGKIHSADQPATANLILASNITKIEFELFQNRRDQHYKFWVDQLSSEPFPVLV